MLNFRKNTLNPILLPMIKRINNFRQTDPTEPVVLLLELGDQSRQELESIAYKQLENAATVFFGGLGISAVIVLYGAAMSPMIILAGIVCAVSVLAGTAQCLSNMLAAFSADDAICDKLNKEIQLINWSKEKKKEDVKRVPLAQGFHQLCSAVFNSNASADVNFQKMVARVDMQVAEPSAVPQ